MTTTFVLSSYSRNNFMGYSKSSIQGRLKTGNKILGVHSDHETVIKSFCKKNW